MRLPAARPRFVILACAACCVVVGSAVAIERQAPGASSCSGCHALGSAAGPAEVPSLDLFSAAEIEAALAAYRSGARSGTIMPRIARGFSPDEARAIAASLGRGPTTAP